MLLSKFYSDFKTLAISGATALSLLLPPVAQATIVQFETAFGNFEVNLYDQTTPKTVANFLQYVEQGDYSNTIIHRSVPGFILQGGGFLYENSWPVTGVASNSAVINEPKLSNVRGTIAMAKLGGDANSATNQWFFNLANNSGNLDSQNGGFTVFGEVTGNGMTIIDQIAALPRYNFGGALTDIPLQAFDNSKSPDNTNLAIISSIVIIDAAANTAANLNPPANTSGSDGSSGGGGAFSWSLLLLGIVIVKRIRN